MEKLVVGILAHVDAGKTTLAESILYATGSIGKLGRVDHKDAFLDTYQIERERGITVFSKQAVFKLKDFEVTLLDTPGHVDFSAEMERTLQVLDYAILMINGSDGIQGHTETLWRLLERYQIPAYIFVNKMDLAGTDREVLMKQIKNNFHDGCIDFSPVQDQKVWMENLALCEEGLLEIYMENGSLTDDIISDYIKKRKIFPCYFGSALKFDGIEELLNGLTIFSKSTCYPKEFGAKVFKIARDDGGNRLTYMKITGGSLKVKMTLTNELGKEEKVDQIRIYSGSRYDTIEEAGAGAICAVTGLSMTYPGEGLGMEEASGIPILEPVLNYKVLLPTECDAHTMLSKLRQMEEEDPQLHIVWSEQVKEIHIQLMGEIQIETLKHIFWERFGINIDFGAGNIVYKETIAEPVEGIGHFEPLRHYAEVHLLLEPDEPGSGLTFHTSCSEDVLDRNWQRLVLSHLEEKEHLGILTGSPITDMKITLVTGRAHLKHTEGGDFRQATYRAVRQGLKMGKSVLLEPYYKFKLEIPTESVGRAMADIGRMCGDFLPPQVDGEMSVLKGNAPVSTMRGYQMEVTSYTSGRGRVICTLNGFKPCHNTEEVMQTIGYDSEKDLDNPTASVFCAHGAGFLVEWDQVEKYMHLEHVWKTQQMEREVIVKEKQMNPSLSSNQLDSRKEERELEAIFERTFGPIKQKYTHTHFGNTESAMEETQMKWQNAQKKTCKEYLLVDGYNIIFAWEELRELAEVNMDAARNKLMDILCNYQGYKKCILLLVFDAYRVKGGMGEMLTYHNIHVVYTKEAETADSYIEKTTHEMAKKHQVTVATSDALEQMIIMGNGALRLSARGLKEEIDLTNQRNRMEHIENQTGGRYFLKDHIKNKLPEIWD